MSITSANAVLIFTVPSLGLVAPVQIQGFAADDIYDANDVAITEVLMGVDGKLSGGFVYVAREWGIMLQADSPSNTFFDAWAQGQTAAAQLGGPAAAPAFANLTLPDIGTTWALVTGFLTGYRWAPPAKKVLQPRKYSITWESVTPATVGVAG